MHRFADRPFIRKLMEQLSTVPGGIPKAAEEMKIAPRAIFGLERGYLPSRADLNAIHAWLTQAEGVTLTAAETEDFRQLRQAASTGLATLPPTYHHTPSPALLRRFLPSPQQITMLVVIVVALAVAVVLVDHRSSGGSTTSSRQPPSPSASASSPAASPSSPSSTGSPAASPSTATTPSSPVTGPGKLLAHYNNFKLACEYSLPFERGAAPTPQSGDGDLYYWCDNDPQAFDTLSDQIDTSDDQIALFKGISPTYLDCKHDTVLGPYLDPVPPGNAVCFRGHGVIAAATVIGYGSRASISYVTLDVQVWQN